MTVYHKGRVVVGLDGVLEAQSVDVVIAAGATTGTATFNLKGRFKNKPHCGISAGISAKTGGSASTKVVQQDVTTRTTTQVVVTVSLDIAPGGVETTTVTVGLVALGDSKL